MTNPYIERKAGDIITAQDWNEMQIKIRDFLNRHSHNGKDEQGVKLDGGALDQTAALSVKGLSVEGVLTVKDICAEGETLLVTGNVGIGFTKPPAAKLAVKGGLHVGGLSDPGDKNLVVDGTATIGKTLTAEGPLSVKKSLNVKGELKAEGTVTFGTEHRQMINLHGSDHGIGIQDHTQYFRSDKNFAWYQGGVHDHGELIPGTNGSAVMVIKNGRVGIGTTDPKAKLDVNGRFRAESFESTNIMVHRMYPASPKVYQNIFDAVAANAIKKIGGAHYDATSHTMSNLWNDRPIICFGKNNEVDGNGAEVNIPNGYDTVWVRVLGERWNAIKAYFTDGRKENIGLWTGGYRSGNCYCPDGSLTDSYHKIHQWVPIPAGRSGKLALIAKPNTSSDFWLSGLAFSKNPWAHATQPAVAYYWALNGGTKITWHSEDWNGDSLAKIAHKTNSELIVPFVASGNDKLLYIVEHNSNWNGCMHNEITVNGKKIERFLSTYDNPFARHWNSKIYNRYIAARIPADLVPEKSGFLNVKINMKKQDTEINLREVGTHDLHVPGIN